MGSVVISVDAELWWGVCDDAPHADRLRSARAGWVELVDLLDEFDAPATWAIVGHLLLDDCEECHPEHPDSPERFEPETSVPRHLRFADGLVDRVRAAGVDHEIGCQGFSHAAVGPDESHRPVVRAEVGGSVDALHAQNLPADTYAYAGHRIAHRDVLAAYGITCYRGAPRTSARVPVLDSVGRAIRALTVEATPPLVEPEVDEYGLVNLPTSMRVFGVHERIERSMAAVRGDPAVRRAKRGIDAAASEDGVFHMWLRPGDLSTGDDVDRVRAILEYLRDRRADADLSVETMREIAARVEEVDRATVTGDAE